MEISFAQSRRMINNATLAVEVGVHSNEFVSYGKKRLVAKYSVNRLWDLHGHFKHLA